MMNTIIKPVFFALLVALLLSVSLSACGDDDDETTRPYYNPDDDDDDILPPVDDDVDDDADDDTDDDADDDTDDDTTPDELTVIINAPANGAQIAGTDLPVQADTWFSDTDQTVITLIGVGNEPAEALEITDYFSIVEGGISGTLRNMEAGTYTLSITVHDGARNAAQDSATFEIVTEAGAIQINKPASGGFYEYLQLPVEAVYTDDVDSGSILVKINGVDITESMTIADGQINGNLTGLESGVHTLHIHGSTAGADLREGEFVDAYSIFTIEFTGAHIEIELDRDTIQTGELVNVDYRVIDDEGNDQTDGATADWDVEPNDGVAIDEEQHTIAFDRSGMFELTIFTLLDGEPVEGLANIWVTARQPGRVEIALNSYAISAGDQTWAQATVYDEGDNPIAGNVIYTAWPSLGVEITQGDPAFITSTRAGDVVIRGTVEGTSVYDEKVLTVAPGDPDHMELTISDPVIDENESVKPVYTIVDEYGNFIEELEANFSVGAGIEGVDWDLDTPEAGFITFYNSGYYLVTAAAEAPWSGVNDSAYVHVVDVTPPQIELWTPERGLWVDEAQVFISGIVNGCDSTTDRIWYTGDETGRALAADCTFQHDYPLVDGLNIVEITVTEESGGVSKAAFSRMKGPKHTDGEPVDDGLRLRMNENGFAQFTSILMPILNDYLEDIPEMVYQMNPLFDEEITYWGVDIASARADCTELTFGDPWFSLDSVRDVGITMDAGITNINAAFRVRGRILGISYSISGELGFDSVGLRAATDIFVDENDVFTVEMYDITMSANGFSFDISGFPDELEDWFSDEIETLIEDLIEDALVSTIPPMLEDLLNDIPQNFSFEIDGIPFDVKYEIDRINWDDTGGSFYMNTGMKTDVQSALVTDFGGSLSSPGTPPSHEDMGQYVPGTQNFYGFGMLFDDDFFNQALYSLYKAGLISQDFEDIAATGDTLIQFAFPGLHDAYPGQVNATLRAMLPPVIIVAPQDSGTDGAIPVEIQIGDLIVNMLVDGADGEKPFVKMAVSLKIPATLDVQFPDNILVLDFGDPEASIYTISEPLMHFENNALFEDAAPLIVELLVPMLGDLVGNIAIPSFGGYSLSVVDEMIMGSSNDFVAIFADLATEE